MKHRRHYVIVVHGMGEQRINSTTYQVVNRFAESRAKSRRHEIGEERSNTPLKTVLPAHLSGQSIRKGATAYGWSEFKGIPVDPSKTDEVFDGTRPDNSRGENFRFAEFYWADILQRHQDRYASKARAWVPSLLERLQEEEITPVGWVPAWGNQLLKHIAETGLSLQRAAHFRFKKLADTIFDGFLGDVHLYGDYDRTRGKAVRRFHVMMDELFMRDFIQWATHCTEEGALPYQPPEFTIIAHSLGSIMALDALTYAFTKQSIREGDHETPCSSLPFLGYTYEEAQTEKRNRNRLAKRLRSIFKTSSFSLDEFEQFLPEEKEAKIEIIRLTEKVRSLLKELEESESGEANSNGLQSAQNAIRSEKPPLPNLFWRNSVRNLITVGSPIDKFLVFWHPKYRHLGLQNPDGTTPDSWKEQSTHWQEFPKDFQKIKHFNFCDVNDPVGHKLDVLHSTTEYKKIFHGGGSQENQWDVLYQRYNLPGAAHIEYFTDSTLFEKIVTEILDGGAKNTQFTDPNFARCKQAEGWTNFLMWFMPILLFGMTAGLVGLAFWGYPFSFTTRAVSLILAVLLWRKPGFLDWNLHDPEQKRPWTSKGVFWLLIDIFSMWRYVRKHNAHHLPAKAKTLKES